MRPFRPSRVWFVIPAILGACAVWASPSAACQCSSRSATRACRDAEVILLAKVTAVDQSRSGAGLEMVDLSGVVTLKGAAFPSQVSISNGDDCPPAQVEAGKSYLIYGPSPSSGGQLGLAHINTCFRVVELSSGELQMVRRGCVEPGGDAADAAAVVADPPAAVTAGPGLVAPASVEKSRSGCDGCAVGPVGTAPSWFAYLGLWAVAQIWRCRPGSRRQGTGGD